MMAQRGFWSARPKTSDPNSKSTAIGASFIRGLYDQGPKNMSEDSRNFDKIQENYLHGRSLLPLT